jgi:hypothetical protein
MATAINPKSKPILAIFHDDDDAFHSCNQIHEENIRRIRSYEEPFQIFMDYDGEFYLRIGIEFLRIDFCPFCGGQLKCGKGEEA